MLQNPALSAADEAHRVYDEETRTLIEARDAAEREVCRVHAKSTAPAAVANDVWSQGIQAVVDEFSRKSQEALNRYRKALAEARKLSAAPQK
jgi:hypothetical protein